MQLIGLRLIDVEWAYLILRIVIRTHVSFLLKLHICVIMNDVLPESEILLERFKIHLRSHPVASPGKIVGH